MLGFFYDFFKIFRKYIVHNNIIINIEDTIYWLFTSIIVFLISLYQNNGEIRIFFILGIFISMLLYNLIISPFFLNLSTKIINTIFKLYLLIFKAICMPFLIIFNIISMPIKFIFNLLKNILQKSKFCVTIYNKILKIKSLILKGVKIQNEKFRK